MTDDLVLFHRTLPDGRMVDVTPLTYGRARLTACLQLGERAGAAQDLLGKEASRG